MERSSYLVIIPTYNEAENVPVITARLRALAPAPDILFVDDDSPDGTWGIAEELGAADAGVHVLRRTDDRGFAPASLEGLHWALDAGYDHICTMDADGSQDPDLIPRLYETVRSGEADISVGSRYVAGGGLEVEWGPVRRATSTLGNAYIRFMLATGVHDNTNSFRCYSREVLDPAVIDAVNARGYVYLPELMFRLRRAGARVVELPTVYIDRKLGASKISWHIIAEAFGRVTVLGLSRLTGRR